MTPIAVPTSAAMSGLRGRDLLSMADLAPAELHSLLDLANELRDALRDGRPHPLCAGRTLGMIFQKQSTRTRVSFEVGMVQLGGYALHLSATNELQLGRGETIADTAMVLSRYLDAIMIRASAQADIEELAIHASIPVINGLTDLAHPCQALADLLTMRDHLGELSGRTLAYVGDPNNVCCSLVEAATMAGMHVIVASPEGYDLPEATARFAHESAGQSGGSLSLTRDPDAAAAGADALYTDVFVSMGQEAEREERMLALQPYAIDENRAALLGESGIVLHCLPARYGEEIDESVLYGPRSAVWDQAENRLHAQKALLAALLA
jgi:ornithine carbamoyltransferase